MKPLLTLAILVLGLDVLHANDHPLRKLDGLWYNQYIDRTIEINAFQDGLKVRGLRGGNRWVWFDRTSPNTYYDQYGNRLRIHDQFIRYNTRHSRGKLTFIKIVRKDRYDERPNHSDRSRNRQNDDRWAEDDFESGNDHYKYDDYDQRWDNRHGSTQNKSNTYKYEGNNTDLEGTWSVNGLDKKVFVTETRDGFKARFDDETKWYSFTKQTSGAYLDENRNKYYFENGQLIWEDYRGTRKYNLTKISDEYGNE